MRQLSSCARRVGALVVALTLMAVWPVAAQPAPPPQPAAPAPPGVPATGAPTSSVAVAQDARQTRGELEDVLRRLPPSVGGVLRLDPSLLRNEAYLATYPTLAGFVQTHPEIVNNADYYFQNVSPVAAFASRGVLLNQAPADPRAQAIGLWRQMLEHLTILFVVLTITGGLVWLVASLIGLRRWSRTSRIQAEMHAKLLDRFTANDDLLAYMQTPAGRRFLEAMPLATEALAPAVSAPVSRMLWSVQAGVVLAIAAIGLLFISGRVIEEIAQGVFSLGVLVLALGIGFVLSAAASYLLSRRLGLLVPAVAARSGPGEA